MKIKFSWRTDEDFAGEEIATKARSQSPHTRLLWVLFLVALGSAGLLYWQQVRRVRAQEEVIEDRISASYEVWHRAVQSGDLELFLYQISNQDARWQSIQRRLFLEQQLLDRQEIGLRYPLEEDVKLNISVELAPDWQTAELSVSYAYDVLAGDGLPRHTLQQTYFYRRYGERWLLSPMAEEFWGGDVSEEMPGLTVIYPERDAEIAARIAQDLHADLQSLCADAARNVDICLDSLQMVVRFESDPLLLASFHDYLTPVFRSGNYVLPAPTLVGLPQDNTAYESLYQGYTARILNTVRENLNPPVALPEQDLHLLCFPQEGRTLQLFAYDATADTWTHELPEQAFRFLMPVPGGEGVILQAFTRGTEAGRLRLTRWQNGQETLLIDQNIPDQLQRPAGWDNSAQPHLMLQAISGARLTQYRWLDLNDCNASGCELVELPGYTTWSPDGRQSLVMQGTELYRGDDRGAQGQPLGTGLSPFWLNEQQYGFVQYDREAGAPSMQLVTATVGIDLPRIVLPVQKLAAMLDAQNPPLLFINYAIVNPGDSDLLLLSATTIGTASGKYNIFSFRLSSGEVRLLQQFEQLPSGYPLSLTPSGHPPFRLSPDGRWLLVTGLSKHTPTTWSFYLYDLHQHEDQRFTAYYPYYPAQYPFYDWTPDGQWLAIVEDGFLRLLAPGYGYQRLVTHRYDRCFFAAWANA